MPSEGKRYLSGLKADQPKDADELSSKRVLMFLAQGFEDVEAVCVADVLGWTRYRPSVATVEIVTTGLHPHVIGAFGTRMRVDIPAREVDPRDFDALVVPGGFHNFGYDEAYCDELRDIARVMHELDRPIATMCVGVLPVAEAGVLVGGEATTYSFSARHDNRGRLRELGCTVLDEPIVVWNNVISCSGPAYSEQVALSLLEMLLGDSTAAQVTRYRRGVDVLDA